ncbi:UTRA domain-containing protein [Streptomonospora salina]|uniref:GntR family transcriptional regulator n=1 Tax=Streptomonospora salina TaxID=104205 RepID=A0A841EG58_9ACTN|nr:UTRA domain-containing protein [Streptomonospora salina]MBB5999390.1 GntR family transcriptional regulator [Streptomonospora salina]
MKEESPGFHYPASRERVRDAAGGHDAFDRFVVDSGRRPSKELQVERTDQAPPSVASRLGTSAALVRRAVRAVDGRTVALETSYYPGDLASGTELEGPDDIAVGTIHVLAANGHPQTGYRDEVAAHAASADDAAALGVEAGTPAVRTLRTAWSHRRVLRVTDTVTPVGSGMVLCFETGAPAPEATGE